MNGAAFKPTAQFKIDHHWIHKNHKNNKQQYHSLNLRPQDK